MSVCPKCKSPLFGDCLRYTVASPAATLQLGIRRSSRRWAWQTRLVHTDQLPRSGERGYKHRSGPFRIVHTDAEARPARALNYPTSETDGIHHLTAITPDSRNSILNRRPLAFAMITTEVRPCLGVVRHPARTKSGRSKESRMSSERTEVRWISYWLRRLRPQRGRHSECFETSLGIVFIVPSMRVVL